MKIIEIFSVLIEEHALTGLFIASFLASTILPIGSEAYVVLLISKGFNILPVIMVASVGNYMGACTTYYIGLKGRSDIIEKYFSISDEQLEKTDKLFARYGSFMLLFTWVPIIGDAITATGGIMKLDFRIFSFFVFIGKTARYIALAYITAGTLMFFR
ncbi:YqaA family protein [uncultured Methanolobus sp.]|uniref:YqaA family protein n=1 Tax=uncultured Methanolobus sp. TaxID=218300 RepID=UPI002AAAD508|nr:YqaA family protein [uncultured Methanolobus sp.]